MDHQSTKGQPLDRRKLEGLKLEVWFIDLSRVSTTLRRLIHLASLRDGRGQYRHSRLVERASQVEIDLVLRKVHEEVFGTWLSFSLKDQHEDLSEYLASINEEKPNELEMWLTLAPYLRLIPTSAKAAERELYRSDIEIVLELLREDFI